MGLLKSGFILLLIVSLSNTGGLDEIYPWASPPGTKSVLFAPGFVTTEFHDDFGTLFSPDGKSFFVRIVGRVDDKVRDVTFEYTRSESGWNDPVMVPFLVDYLGALTTLSADGTTAWFCSNAPLFKGDDTSDFNIWVVRRTASGWGVPEPLPPLLNSEEDELFPSVAADGTLFFQVESSGRKSGADIYMSPFENGENQVPQCLPFCTNATEASPLIDPQGRYLIFAGSGREDSFGMVDLYICRREENGGWAEPVNLGHGVNTAWMEKFPTISPDGKFLFFVSTRPPAADTAVSGKYRNMLEPLVGHPLPGRGDIYCVSTAVFDDLF